MTWAVSRHLTTNDDSLARQLPRFSYSVSMNKRILASIIGAIVFIAPLSASAQSTQADQAYIEDLKRQVRVLQELLNNLLHPTPAPRVQWIMEDVSSTQKISIDLTTASGTTRFALGTSSGCTASTECSYQGWRDILGTIICFHDNRSTTFTAYYEPNHFYLERIDFNTENSSESKREFLVNVRPSKI